MCDLSPVYGILATAAVLIAVAIGLVIAAAAANNSFFGAGASPALMVAAGIASAAAAATLGGSRALVEDYYRCMGSPEACLGALNNLLNAIAGLMTVLSIQSTASFVAAGIAWIPWAGSVPMGVILGAFILQAALIPATAVFLSDLINCVQEAERSAASRAAAPLVAAGVTTIIFLGPAFFFRASGGKRDTIVGR